MKVEIEVISKETLIKPCTPTPHKLHHYSLSYLDQILPPIFMPLVYFYPSSDRFSNTERSDKIKLSLSEALTKFYPLAGRVVDNLYVDSNDKGVPYVEVAVKCNLIDIISHPIPNELNKFIPYELDDVKDLALVVQVNFFECGGMAIGIAISHKLADAASCFMFINTWAAIARCDCDHDTCPFNPCFDSATLFPPKDASLVRDAFLENRREKIVTKRFVFSNSDISDLRDEYTDHQRMRGSVFERIGRCPSRILVLSAFLWRRFMATVHYERDPNKIYAVTHSVNLRGRTDPPLPDSLFGNIMRSVLVVPFFDKGSEDEGFKFMNLVRESIEEINSEFVSKLMKNDEQHLNLIQERANDKRKGQMALLSFSSLCKFPLYEADFGWGKPIWVGSGRLATKDIIGFMDTKSGDGVEAWVNLEADDMAKFEVDKKLLAFYVLSGDGVEAWANLEADDMAKFEADMKLLAFCDRVEAWVNLKVEGMSKFEVVKKLLALCDGVEACVNLEAEDMAKYEADKKLLDFCDRVEAWVNLKVEGMSKFEANKKLLAFCKNRI